MAENQTISTMTHFTELSDYVKSVVGEEGYAIFCEYLEARIGTMNGNYSDEVAELNEKIDLNVYSRTLHDLFVGDKLTENQFKNIFNKLSSVFNPELETMLN